MSTLDRADRESGAVAESQDEQAPSSGSSSEMLRLRAMHRRWVQRKAAGGGGGGAAAIPESGGAPLAGEVRGRMERTLGADLSGARVHTGGESAEAADAMGARAFTVGSDVHFGRGEFAPGSKEGDRLLAHELAHVVQGQKSGVQRKADAHAGDAHGDHEAGGHEVSEPGDPAEQEADAAGDQAAEALHGGKKNDKKKDKQKRDGNAEDKEHEAGADAGERDGHADAAGGEAHGDEKPKLGAAAAGVARKIFRAPRPNAPGGAPPRPAAASGGAAAPAAPAANALSPADQRRVAQLKTTLETAQVMPGLNATLTAMQADITRFTSGPQAQDAAVVALKAAYDAKKAALEQAFDTALNGAAQAITQINVQQPGAFAQYQATWKAPEVDKWAGLAMFSFKDRPAAAAFKQARETQERAIRDKHRETITKALQDVRAVPNEPDPAKPDDNPMAKADAAFDGVRPWMNALGSPSAWETQLQDAYVAKREQINTATAAREAKKAAEQAAAAEKQKQQQQQQAQQAATGGAGATAGPAPGGAATAAAPPTAHAPSPQQAPASAAAPAQANPAQPAPTPQPAASPAPTGQAHPPAAGGGATAAAQPANATPPPQPAPSHAGAQAQQPPPANAGATAPAAAPAQAQPAPAGATPQAAAAGASAATPAAQPAGQGLTPEQENKLQQLEVMLEIASGEALESTNAYNLGATIVTNLATVANPGFLALALGKSAAVLTAKFKHEFDTKVATKMIKQLPPDQIDALLTDWTASMPGYEGVMADIKVAHGKALSAKAKVGAGVSGAGQLGKDDWKELLVEGGEVAEHVAKELVHELPHVVETVGHALPFLGIATSVWGVIANIRKIRHLRAELKVLQDAKFGPGGQPAASAPPSTPAPTPRP